MIAAGSVHASLANWISTCFKVPECLNGIWSARRDGCVRVGLSPGIKWLVAHWSIVLSQPEDIAIESTAKQVKLATEIRRRITGSYAAR